MSHFSGFPIVAEFDENCGDEFQLLALGGGPNHFVAIDCHHVQHHAFVLQDVGVSLTVDKGQRRSTAPDVVAVGRVIAISPCEGLTISRSPT